MESASIWHWFIILGCLAMTLVPTSQILRKAGFSGWWAILALIPLVNFIAFWVFAFIRWPGPDAQHRA